MKENKTIITIIAISITVCAIALSYIAYDKYKTDKALENFGKELNEEIIKYNKQQEKYEKELEKELKEFNKEMEKAAKEFNKMLKQLP